MIFLYSFKKHVVPLIIINDIYFLAMVDVKTNCFGTVDMDHNMIMSPNYPNEYPHDLNCTWKLIVPLGNRIQLHFEKFSIYKSYDYMTIYDGSQNKNNILATLSGEFSHDLHSNGSRLVLHFETSKKNEKFIGFQIQYDDTINILFPTIFNKIIFMLYIHF